jgi:DNA polymerase I-like protein with 3'-5' exonuclease and polymerase domains/5'-3' exonuclease
MKLVVDVSSVVKTCLFAGKDKEFGRQVVFDGKEVQVNSAGYGVENAINRTVKKLKLLELTPRDLVLVVEGKHSKALRTAMWEGYKATRGETAPEVNAEFVKARDEYVQTFLDLGAQACSQQGLESDDVIAYLAQALPNCFIDSNDGDMAVLVSDTAHVINGANEVDTNPLGPFPNRYVTLYKALVGDTQDNIKGARGFGPAAWLDLFCRWGEDGLDAMTDLIRTKTLERLVEDVAELPKLQKIIDDMQGVYLSYDLARMYPEKVNTYRNPLKWQVGMVKPAPERPHPLLADWYGRRKVVHAHNFAATLAFIRAHIDSAPYVGLDIESWTPQESDDWLEARKKRAADDDDLGVDVLGQRLAGLGLTFGDNDQFTFYFAIGHNMSDGLSNLTHTQLVEVLNLIPTDKAIVVHNSSFELSVMHREVGVFMERNGWHGFLPNVHDTLILSSYVDENQKKGLKNLSSRLLGYEQVTYKEATQGRKMNEMSATEVRDYACDDPICTLALYNHFKMICEIEQTWKTYLEVETAPAYLNALRFNQGTPISMEELLKQEREDQEAYNKGEAVLQQYLISAGWEGTVCPQATCMEDITAAFIKQAFEIVTKEQLGSRARTPSKLVAMIEAADDLPVDTLVMALREALDHDVTHINKLLKLNFDGAPQFNLDSPVQCCRLLYEVMKLPPRVFNKRTDKQRAAGQARGNPRGDGLSLEYALLYDVKPGTPEHAALKALQAMKVAHTKQKMFYTPYKTVCHWTDGLVHAYMNQCAAVTRRYSSSSPNLQQLPKHAKATGVPPKFRRVIVPHHRRALIVSMDFEAQELHLIAERSQDANLLACFVGDNKKDVHALTASGILAKKALARRFDELWTMGGREGGPPADFPGVVTAWKDITYEGFVALETGPWAKLYKNLRALGKKTNFTTEFGAMAPKLAETLIVSVEEAQQYIDAKLLAFPRVDEWKTEEMAKLHKTGYTCTLMGARRHLAPALTSGNSYDIGGAERQGVNHEIQGSAGEQTKLAEGRIWKSDLLYRMDARYIGPIHDELVFSVGIDCLVEFLTEAHARMIAPYGGMQVPIVSSISLGLNFGDQIECGATVDVERINDVLYRGYEEGGKRHAPLFPSEERLAA